MERNKKMTTTKSREKVSEQNNLQEALRDSQSQMSGIIASAMDAIITIDDSQHITLFNKSAEVMFGYSSDEILGQPIDRLLPERVREKHHQHIRRFGDTGVTNRSMGRLGTLFGQRANGEEFPIEASISQVTTTEGRLFTVILRDITERVKVEEALQAKTDEIRTMSQQLWQTAKLATMGELAASIAHELNNPLAILSLRIESLLSSTSPDSEAWPELEVMEREVDRMAALVSNLLQFSRSSDRQVSSLHVEEEVTQTLDLVQNYLINRQVSTQREFAPNLPMLQADRQQLRQLFLNLFTNAADAMPKGGTLRIRVQPEEKQKIKIEVIDNGIGIPAESIRSVMEPFFTTKPEGKGTGLGLSICRRIVEEHHGSIDILSEGKDKGTTIRVILPSVSETKTTFITE